MHHRWRSGAIGYGVRAEGAMRGAGYARLRRAGGTERGRERGGAWSRERRQRGGGRGADRAADYREKMLRRGMDTDAF